MIYTSNALSSPLCICYRNMAEMVAGLKIMTTLQELPSPRWSVLWHRSINLVPIGIQLRLQQKGNGESWGVGSAHIDSFCSSNLPPGSLHWPFLVKFFSNPMLCFVSSPLLHWYQVLLKVASCEEWQFGTRCSPGSRGYLPPLGIPPGFP